MKKHTLNTIIFLLVVIAVIFTDKNLYSAQMGIIPYKITNPAKGFNADTGLKYAKYLGVTAYLKKGMTVYSHYQFGRDLAKFGLNPNKTITKNDLIFIGESRYLVYIVAGNLIKTSNGYRAESILYSNSRKDVIARSSVEAATLHELAVADTQELFSYFVDVKTIAKSGNVDAAILFDTSFNVNKDWTNIKKGIRSFSSELMNTWEGSKVYLLPYNSVINKNVAAYSTSVGIASALKKIKLKGNNEKTELYAAFRKVIENIPWRKESGKVIVLVTNSPFKDENYLKQFYHFIRKKNIQIYTIALGKTKKNDIVKYAQLAEISDGKAFDVTYRQVLYDKNGKRFYLYMQSGRLFQGDSNKSLWQKGLFSYLKNRRYGYAKPPTFAEELNLSSLKQVVTPYNMSRNYLKYGDRIMMGNYELRSNIQYIFENLPALYADKNKVRVKSKPLARVLLSDGKISVWSNVVNRKDLDFFENSKADKRYVLLGVRVVKKKNTAYGVSFNPYNYVTDIKKDYIPTELYVSLKKIVKNTKYYMTEGLFRPPLWFLRVKVEKIRYKFKTKDIRDFR